MGSARTAPDPKFEENLSGLKNLPEDKRGMAFATTLLTGGSGANSIMGQASGGRSLLGAVPGIVKPSASATIKAPEPTPEPKADPNMQMFVGSDLADKAEFSRRTGLTEVDPSTEKRIKEFNEQQGFTGYNEGITHENYHRDRPSIRINTNGLDWDIRQAITEEVRFAGMSGDVNGLKMVEDLVAKFS